MTATTVSLLPSEVRDHFGLETTDQVWEMVLAKGWETHRPGISIQILVPLWEWARR